MVMEQTLSPQCVGREFVRQYYTLLNEAPAHLHRFYNNSSSFIHGEPDAKNRETVTVVGQRQIHQRIQELNFRDCHAKITQVDSQATLGNAVVVQVTGELSNNGQPMRRFTQTFVLASQNPKKYYVHNDIFRYQDALDEDMEGDMVRSDLAEEDQEQDVRQNEIRLNDSQPEPYYTPTVNGTAEPKIEEVNNLPSEQHIPQQMNSMTLELIPQPLPQMGQQDNGSVLLQNSTYEPEPEQESLEPEEPQQEPQVYHTQQVVTPQQPPAMQQQQQQQQQPQPLGSSEPKTYANQVKAGTNLTMPNVFYNSAPPQAATSPPAQAPQSSPPTAVVSPLQLPNSAPEAKLIDLRQNSTARPPRNDVGRNNYSPRPTNNSDDNGTFGGSGDAERRRTTPFSERNPQYPDCNQVFVGNVPIVATESELRDLFGKFGTIIDLRMHSKGNTKSSGQRVPNYGFVVYEDPSSVQAVLNSKQPITYPNGNGGVKLNVEEKKAKGRGGGEGGGRGGARGGGGLMRSGAGPMGGSGAGRGGSGTGRGALRGSYGPNPIRSRH